MGGGAQQTQLTPSQFAQLLAQYRIPVTAAAGPQQASWADYLKAINTPSTTDQVIGGIGKGLMTAGRQIGQSGIGMQAVSMPSRPGAGAAALQQMAANPQQFLAPSLQWLQQQQSPDLANLLQILQQSTSQ
jgi:hypothetical protein